MKGLNWAALAVVLAGLGLLPATARAVNEEDLLPVDQAYVLSAKAVSRERVEFTNGHTRDHDGTILHCSHGLRAVFRTARLIGRRFVIVHVRFGNEIIEVTTFRGAITDHHERDETGRILSDNEYGTLETDAIRRDFVANVSHEIRTPLTVMSGFVETLQTLNLSADEQKREAIWRYAKQELAHGSDGSCDGRARQCPSFCSF